MNPDSGPAPIPDESLLDVAVRRRTGDRRAHAEAEVRRLVEAGLALMTEDPTASPRVTDVIRRAGVSNDAFYRAFPGKDDLMAAVADDGARRLSDYVRHQRDKAEGPGEQVRACVVAVMKQAADPRVAATTRAVLRNTSRTSRKGEAVGVRARVGALLVEPLRALGGVDPERDAVVIACSAFAVMEQFLWSEEVPTHDDVDHLVRFLLAGAVPGDARTAGGEGRGEPPRRQRE